MDKVYVVQKATGPVACLLGPMQANDPFNICRGCQAYDHLDIGLCLDLDVDCDSNGYEVLAAIQVHQGTRFTAETHTGRIIKEGIVMSIVEWRDHPLQVHWTDETGKHIEPFALHEFKRFKFL